MPRRKLTENEWRRVFELRCVAKQGQRLGDDEMRLIKAAYAEDPKRYTDMNADVFDATVPFGSTAKANR